MKSNRITRVNELIQRELGLQLYRIVNDAAFNPARVTFSRVNTSADLRSGRVWVSIRGTPAEQQEHLNILKNHRPEFQAAISKNVVLRYTPHLKFVLDHSIAEGDQVLNLIQRMEASGEIAPDSPDLPPSQPDSGTMPADEPS